MRFFYTVKISVRIINIFCPSYDFRLSQNFLKFRHGVLCLMRILFVIFYMQFSLTLNISISDTSNPPSRSNTSITVSNYSHPGIQNYTAIWMVPDDDNGVDAEDDTESQSTGINVSVIH